MSLNEQVQMPDGKLAVSNEPVKEKEKKNRKSALYAFPIGSDELAQIKQILETGSGQWKSNIPLKTIQGGVDGPIAEMEGKPIYLMIRISDTKQEKPSLELADRIYVLYDTTKKELEKNIRLADNYMDRIRVAVDTPSGEEHSLTMWQVEPSEGKFIQKKKEEKEPESEANVEIDLKKQMQAPGTSAGISIS